MVVIIMIVMLIKLIIMKIIMIRNFDDNIIMGNVSLIMKIQTLATITIMVITVSTGSWIISVTLQSTLLSFELLHAPLHTSAYAYVHTRLYIHLHTTHTQYLPERRSAVTPTHAHAQRRHSRGTAQWTTSTQLRIP